VWLAELIAHRTHTRDLDVHIAIEQMLHQHHRVVSFLDRLAVKVLRQLRQFGAGEIDADSHVLLRGREFVEDLLLH
jgi:hypothetical protein